MALLFAEGFDGYADIADLNVVYPGGVLTDRLYAATGGINGGGAMFLDNDDQDFPIYPAVQGQSVRLGFYFKKATTGNGSDYIVRLWSWKGSHISIEIDEGLLEFTLTSSPYTQYAIPIDVEDLEWHHLEVYWRISQDDTSGDLTLKIWHDGLLVIDVLESGFYYYGEDYPTRIVFEGHLDGMYFDDIIIWDDSGTDFTGHQGPLQIETLRPTGDGNTTGWTTSTGTDHYDLVDGGMGGDAGDAAYIETTGDGVKELFAFENTSLSPVDIRVVTFDTRSKSTGAASSVFKQKVRIGGTDYDAGTSDPLSASFTLTQGFSFENPATGSAWTASDIDGAEFGFETDTA